MTAITLGNVGDLPPTLDGHQAAEILGVSYWSLLDLHRRGEAPVEPLKLGRKLRWPTAAVLRAVGIDAARGDVPGPQTGDVPLVPTAATPDDEGRDHRAG